jgi:hypothetical protein
VIPDLQDIDPQTRLELWLAAVVAILCNVLFFINLASGE